VRPLARELEAAGYRVHNLDYPSTRGTPDALVEVLQGEISRCCAWSARVNFVTHSLGGVMVRAYLAKHPMPQLGRVVMLAPPNHGSEYVDVAGHWRLFQAVLGPTAAQLGTAATRRLREAGAAPRRARRERVALGRGARAARAADRRRARARRPRAPRAAHALGSAPGRDEPVRRVPSAPYARDRSRGGGAGAARHLGGRLVNRPTNSGAKPSGQRASSQAPRSGAQRVGAERSRKGCLEVRGCRSG